MAWDDDFLELMPNTVTFHPPTAPDGYGKRNYGTPYSCSARVENEVHDVETTQGQTVTALGSVWIPPAGDASIAGPSEQPDIFTLIDLPDGTQQSLLAIEQVMDEDGLHHLKLHYGNG